METRSYKLRMLIYSAMFAAITGILAQLSIPLPLGVPFTGQTLAVGLAATILGSRYGALAMICYAAIGAIGIPVFAEGKAGLQILVGPTGGYIYSFIISAFVIGWILKKTKYSVKVAMIANIIGMAITLIIGMIHLKFSMNLSWNGAFIGGVAPFIPLGIVKAFLASYIGIKVRERLVQADLIEGSTKANQNQAII